VVGVTRTDEGRRRRSDAERNIRGIVDAAMGVLAEHPRASMQEIAAAAGLHRATVHRHFATRDDLVRAVRERALDDFAALVNDEELADLSPALALEELTRRALELGDRDRVYRVTASFDDVSDRRTDVLLAPLVGIVARAHEAGAVRTDLPPDLLALAWGGLVLVVLPQVADGMALDDAVRFVLTMLATPAAGPARG
jgi:TetR/AcrR family transcriptional regulator, mexCD-oprJ operon repressor